MNSGKRKKPPAGERVEADIPEMSNGERADLYRERKKKFPTWRGSAKRKLR